MTRRVALWMLLVAAVAQAAERPWPPTADKASIMLTAERLFWRASLPGMPPEVKFAALEGNPSDAGPFTIRVALPAGLRMPWHHYPEPIRMTVIAGLVAMGVEEREVGAGGFYACPAQHPETYVAREASILQISSTGPWRITYLNTRDDRRSPSESK